MRANNKVLKKSQDAKHLYESFNSEFVSYQNKTMYKNLHPNKIMRSLIDLFHTCRYSSNSTCPFIFVSISRRISCNSSPGTSFWSCCCNGNRKMELKSVVLATYL